MVRPKEEDSTLIGLLQGELGKGDDQIRALLRQTLQQVLEEELTAFLLARTMYKQQYSFTDNFLQITTPHDFDMGNVDFNVRLQCNIHIREGVNMSAMTRKEFLKQAACFGGAAVAYSLGGMTASAQGKRPNVIFILADDLGWGDLPCYGNQNTLAHGGWNVRGELKMPALDRMASEGTRFTQFYVASGVCSPSRAGFMTGCFPGSLGIHDYLGSPELNRKRGCVDSLDTSIPTVTRLLKDAGYTTAHFGKWHLSSGPNAPKPTDYGIDLYDTCIKGSDGRVRSAEVIADSVISFVEANKDKPFFINAWVYDPHSPLHPTEEMMDVYKNLGTGWKGHRGAFEVYYGVLTNLDRHIGRIFEALDRLGLSENTIVIFSSDNGFETGLIPFISHYGGAATSGPFRGLKRSLYEGGIRTPLIVRWPEKTPANAVDNRSVIGGVDFLPTICALTGVKLPGGMKLDGEDMSGAILGKPKDKTKTLMWENRFPVYGNVLDMSPILCIRESKWKLLMNPDRSRIELFDIPNDPSEMSNLAEKQPDVVRNLSRQVLAWSKTLPPGPVDSMAGRNDYPWPKPR